MYIDNYDYYIFNPIFLNKKIKLNWRSLWIKKSDYISKYISKIRKNYKEIDESIDYYLTMLEMAIYYLKDYDNYIDYAYVQHKIINNMELNEDVKERDFSEYLKYTFFNKNYSMNYIYDLIEKGINIFNYDLVVARLLFPSYYLFYLEKYIIDGENNLNSIIERTSEYELYVKNIVNRINLYRDKKIVLPF